MREEKYSNVVNETTEKIKEQKEKDLSLTRELKFSALQEQLDLDNENEEEILSAEERIALAKKRLKEEKEEKLDKSSDFSNILEKEPTEKTKEEELYITKALRPVKMSHRIFKFVLKLAFFCVFVFFLYLGTRNYIIPTIKKHFFASPLDVFEKNLDGIIQEIEKFDRFDYQNIFKVDSEIKVNSNIEDFASLKDHQLTKTTFYSKENNLFANTYSLKNNDVSFSYSDYEKNNNYYNHFSTSENIYNLGEIQDLKVSSLVNRLSNAYYSDFLRTILLKELNMIKDEISEDNVTSNEDELTINDKTIAVKRNSFTLEGKKLDDFLKKNEKEYLKDELINNYLNNFIQDSNTDPTTNFIEVMIADLIDELDSVALNIYTDEKNKFVGLDLEENGFRKFHYYTDQSSLFSIYLNLDDGDLKENLDSCTFELLGNKKSSTTEIEVIYNTKKVGTLNLNSFTKEKISLTYEIFLEDIKLNGDLLIYNDYDTGSVEFSIRSSGNFINITTKAKYSKVDTIEDFNNYKTTKYLEEPYNNEFTAFHSALAEKNLLEDFNNYYILFSLDGISELFSEDEDNTEKPGGENTEEPNESEKTENLAPENVPSEGSPADENTQN